jgi:chromosome segregation ATPase
MTLFSTQLVLPASAPRPKAARISQLNSPDLRKQLRLGAQALQEYLGCDAPVRPHFDKLTQEVKRLKATCSEHEANIKEMEDAIRKADEQHENPEDGRQEKLEIIAQLEERYKRLLAEKEALLARADDGSFD